MCCAELATQLVRGELRSRQVEQPALSLLAARATPCVEPRGVHANLKRTLGCCFRVGGNSGYHRPAGQCVWRRQRRRMCGRTLGQHRCLIMCCWRGSSILLIDRPHGPHGAKLLVAGVVLVGGGGQSLGHGNGIGGAWLGHDRHGRSGDR